MILDFNCFVINESSLKKLKKDVHGVLNMSARKRMRRELRDNIITFKFRKRNGDLRTAHGTLHPDYLPPLKGGPKPPDHQMVYYDLDKEGWRSFRSYSFIKILNIKPVGSTSVAPTPPPKSSAAAKGSSQDDDEEIKKNSEMESEEQEEKEVKKVSKKHDDEDEEKHEYKSPIYDEDKEEKEEREEDDDKVKEIEHKHKEKKKLIHDKEPEEEEESEETDKKDKKKGEEE